MPYASRYRRPAAPRQGLRLQERDLAILDAAYVHRYVVSHHVQALVFPGVSLWRAQARLRSLWEHRLLDRFYTHGVLRSGESASRLSQQPIYALSARGAEALATARDASAEPFLHALRLKARSRPTFEHHLVVTDFMVALRLALGRSQLARVARTEHEHVLWPRVKQLARATRKRGVIVPDGAITLELSSGRRLTLYLEVVRAGPSGGNKTIREKLVRYATLHHQGFFKTVYGHEHLRAVIFATTSAVRAERFRAFGRDLTHGRRLFWFGSYLSPATRARSCFTPTSILSHPWRASSGAALALRDLLDG